MSQVTFIPVDWATMKSFVDERKLSMQWLLLNGSYYIKAMDGFYAVETVVHTDGDMPSEKIDFEDNYKPLGNRDARPFFKIQEERPDAGTQSIYQGKGFRLEMSGMTANTWHSEIFSFPYPISLFSASWIAKLANNGDCVEFLMAPNSIIGAITSDITAGDTVINVSQTVIDNIKKGYLADFTDTVTSEPARIRVIGIDKVALTITLESGTENAYAATDPTYVMMTVQMIDSIFLVEGPVVSLGRDAIGGSFVPASTPLEVRYKNIDGVDKNFPFIMELKY